LLTEVLSFLEENTSPSTGGAGIHSDPVHIHCPSGLNVDSVMRWR
jgi:hypothetical protein